MASPVSPQKPPYKPAQSGSGQSAPRQWNSQQGGNATRQQGSGGGSQGGWQKREPRPHLAAGAEGEKPDPVKFAEDVARWAKEPKIPTDRGYINREIIPGQIHNGTVCERCHEPKVHETKGEPFCFGCGFRPDLHGYGARLELKRT